MASDQYRNYIKHLASIVQAYESAPKRIDGWAVDSEAHGTLARAESAIRKICDDNSPYTQRMQKILDKVQYDDPIKAGLVIGIVKALKGDLEDGYLATFPELVRGEMFENLIEMAKHLLEEGYKDAAAVIAGTSRESHLRQLSIKRGLQPTTTAPDGAGKKRSAESLNQELRKNGAYGLFDQKQVTAWLDLRNNAAHGNYSAYNENDVAKLIEWVSDFISTHPA